MATVTLVGRHGVVFLLLLLLLVWHRADFSGSLFVGGMVVLTLKMMQSVCRFG